ncbi:MAG: flavodoxin-dependent (E)-4-hydroxy-3-methylbut-2-enyl-diphosphate synthase [Clostridia bacterium]|nr:flavodoxin-dependent (E)-4-hydroxy-3-methylbut-2-enyl-diphosphate synthase [Clostridia bacterium]
MGSKQKITVGGVQIGGGAPLVIQSMCNTRTQDVTATVKQILALEQAGCEVVRLAIPDMEAAQAVSAIKKQVHVPLVADIHFDYRLALEALRGGIDKIRINPGNIGDKSKVKAVADACRAAGVPIRVGVNSGSVDADLRLKYGVTPETLCQAALRNLEQLEDCGFYDSCVSLKMSNVFGTIRAYRLMAEKCDYPLHLGVTEAGNEHFGTLRSAAAFGALLCDGIGDTLRVSLTADPVREVRAAKDILKALDLHTAGARIISCPTCGRTQIDLIGLAERVEQALSGLKSRLTVAVMGCVVNGPGEAREADIGICGGRGEGLIIRKGEILYKVPEDQLLPRLIGEIEAMTGEKL